MCEQGLHGAINSTRYEDYIPKPQTVENMGIVQGMIINNMLPALGQLELQFGSRILNSTWGVSQN